MSGVARIGPGYLVLSVLLVACAVAQVVREPWISDFWEHAAKKPYGWWLAVAPDRVLGEGGAPLFERVKPARRRATWSA